MNNFRLFSVIMPNFNKGKYIEQSIISVLNQSYPNFELIIIDDGSTDDSLNIISQFNDSRIRLIKQENSGVSVTRNNGIKSAKYDYIAFLDSDDVWLPFFLEEMNLLIDEFPDAGAYGCAFLREKLTEKTFSNAEKRYADKVMSHLIIENYFYSTLHGMRGLTASTSIVKKSVFDKYGYFPVGLKRWEDYDMWIRIGLYSEIAYTDKVCAIYNDVQNSASRDKSNLHAPVFDNYKDHIRKSGICGRKKKDFIVLVSSKECHAAYEQYLVDRDRGKALRRVIKFWRYKFFDRLYWSEIIQFIFTPEKVLLLNNKINHLFNK